MAVAAEKSSPYETLELRYQGGSGYVSYPELAADLGYLDPIKLRWIGNTISGPQDIQTVVTNDIEFGAAFNGSIIKLIEAKALIRAVIGMSSVDDATWTGFYVLDGSPIHSARDILGRKVAMNTVGAHSEFMLREFLVRGGLSKPEIDQVTLVAIPPVNSEQVLRQKQVDVATLGGILRDKALERGGIHAVFRDYDLFGEFTSAAYVLRTDFIAKIPTLRANSCPLPGKPSSGRAAHPATRSSNASKKSCTNEAERRPVGAQILAGQQSSDPRRRDRRP